MSSHHKLTFVQPAVVQLFENVVVQPTLLHLLGNVKNKKILQIGCGTGYWMRILSKEGAKCTGFDSSEDKIKIAKNALANAPHNQIHYFVGDPAKKHTLENNSFDVILLEKVLLEIADLSTIKKILEHAYPLLKKDGKIIISELHPFAPQMGFSSLEVDSDYYYFKSGAEIISRSRQLDGTTVTVTHFHHTFQDLINAVADSGFRIAKLLEPTPEQNLVSKYFSLAHKKDKPVALIIVAGK